uniref:Uncharacterized protein n=1 Tax=Arundo donax TaxID=35708 RepID=A0A0A9HD29_ARUDO
MTTMIQQHAAVAVHVYCIACPLAPWRMPPIDLIVAICCPFYLPPPLLPCRGKWPWPTGKAVTRTHGSCPCPC